MHSARRFAIDISPASTEVHRALSPECILVNAADGKPRVRIFNWQAGREITGTTRGSLTVDPREFLEPISAVYLPPEAVNDPHARSETMDVFSLGALAFLVFTNQPPAANFHELYTLLAQHRGLPVPAILDAASETLQRLIREATQPDVDLRTGSADEFLRGLNEFEEEWTAPDTVANPLEARAGDRLPGNLAVKQRLGSSSTATAFRVEQNGRDYVLELALKPEHTERLRAELETLRQLDHPFIVKPHSDLLDIGGHAAFLMDRAGEARSQAGSATTAVSRSTSSAASVTTSSTPSATSKTAASTTATSSPTTSASTNTARTRSTASSSSTSRSRAFPSNTSRPGRRITASLTSSAASAGTPTPTATPPPSCSMKWRPAPGRIGPTQPTAKPLSSRTSSTPPSAHRSPASSNEPSAKT